MKKLIFICIFVFGSLGCDEEEFKGSIVIHPPEPPFLRISNQINDNYAITSWKMEGYEYNDLHIPPGSTEQFLLNSGMRNGYNDKVVTIFLSSYSRSFTMSIKVNFLSGSITTITILSEDQIESKW